MGLIRALAAKVEPGGPGKPATGVFRALVRRTSKRPSYLPGRIRQAPPRHKGFRKCLHRRWLRSLNRLAATPCNTGNTLHCHSVPRAVAWKRGSHEQDSEETDLPCCDAGAQKHPGWPPPGLSQGRGEMRTRTPRPTGARTLRRSLGKPLAVGYVHQCTCLGIGGQCSPTQPVALAAVAEMAAGCGGVEVRTRRSPRPA